MKLSDRSAEERSESTSRRNSSSPAQTDGEEALALASVDFEGCVVERLYLFPLLRVHERRVKGRRRE